MKLYSIVFLMIVLVAIACGSGANDPVQLDIKVTGISVLDYGNNVNASDIRISFREPAELMAVGSFRVFVIKSSSEGSFDLATALSLSADRYQAVPVSAIEQPIDLDASLNDSEGEAVTEGVAYKIAVLSVAAQADDQESQLSDFSAEFRLERKNVVKTLVSDVDGGSGGMDIDAAGNIYMGDFGQTTLAPKGNKVLKITPAGSVFVFASGFTGASGNVFDSEGNLYQANIGGAFISKITPVGSVSTFASGGPMSSPVGMVFGENNHLFVADCEGYQILEIDEQGTISVFSDDTEFNCPNGITRDEEGNLYVANFYDDKILKVTPGKTVSVLTTLPKGNTLNGNNGHIIYHDGFLYAIARSANQIFKIGLDGEKEVFAGSGIRGRKDGAALSASFSLPNDLVFSKDGSKLFINDVVPTTGNSSIIAPCNIRVIEIVE